MVKRYIARRRLEAAVGYYKRVLAARDSALQGDAPTVVLDAYDTAVAEAEDRWAGAVRALAVVS